MRRERAQLPRHGEQRQRDRQLTELDAEVERDQRRDDRRAVATEADVLERARKAEAVDQTKRKREPPTRNQPAAGQPPVGPRFVRFIAAGDVLYADEDDAGGN